MGCVLHLSITFWRDVNLMFQNVKQPLMTQTGRNFFREASTPQLSTAKDPTLTFEVLGSALPRLD